jgi:transposase
LDCERLVRHENDYILRLIEELSGLVRAALDRLSLADPSESHELGAQAIGLALSLDPELASGLTPRSLSTLLRLGTTDERLLALVQQALEIEAATLERSGDAAAAGFRRGQAEAVRSLLES